jgi:hypothetical protein
VSQPVVFSHNQTLTSKKTLQTQTCIRFIYLPTCKIAVQIKRLPSSCISPQCHQPITPSCSAPPLLLIPFPSHLTSPATASPPPSEFSSSSPPNHLPPPSPPHPAKKPSSSNTVVSATPPSGSHSSPTSPSTATHATRSPCGVTAPAGHPHSSHSSGDMGR